jgi:phenylacetic acid degradation operon negative regulatory protein
VRQDRKAEDRSPAAEQLGLRPLTARSVLLSALLGTTPPRLPVGRLVRAAELFGITEGAARTALSRMAAAGDVQADDGRYRLSPRLMDRRRRQDESRADPRLAWDGSWSFVVVTADRRTANERAELRATMARLRYAELREGVWLRPANLPEGREGVIEEHCQRWTARPDDDVGGLAEELWPLVEWAERARTLGAALDDGATLAERFMVSAAALHHLLSDPLLPDELLPADWPGGALRRDFDRFYATYQAELQRYLASTG